MNYLYAISERVEARDPATNQWRIGYVASLKPYRGKPGYDVFWLPHVAPSEGSAGGWQYEATMRKANR